MATKEYITKIKISQNEKENIANEIAQWIYHESDSPISEIIWLMEKAFPKDSGIGAYSTVPKIEKMLRGVK